MRIRQKSHNNVTKTVYVWFEFLWIRRYLHNWTNKYLLNNENCRHLLLKPEFYRVHRWQRTDFRYSAQKSSGLRLMTLIVFNSYLIRWSEGSEIPQQLVGILSHRLTSRFPVLFKNIFWPFLMRRQTHDIDNWFDLLEFWRTSKRNRTLVAVPTVGAVHKLRKHIFASFWPSKFPK